MRSNRGDWLEGEELFLFVGEPERRKTVEAQYLSSRPGLAIVQLLGDWRRFEIPGGKRFPVSIDVSVNAPGVAPVQGTLKNVGHGGLGVYISREFTSESAEIVIEDGGFFGRLPCRIAHVQPEGEFTLLDLAFLALPGPQEAFVRNLVARAVELADAA